MQLSLYFEDNKIPSAKRDEMHSLVEQAGNSVDKAVGSVTQVHRLNIIVAGAKLIRQLNSEYRHKDTLTDVLSFPMGQEEEVTGEIYLCWPRVMEQADEFGHSWQREFSFLLVHGILHLLGYEHEEEPNLEMRAMEERILELMFMGRN